MSHTAPPPVATPPSTSRPAAVTTAVALLWTMAVAGLAYATSMVAVAPPTIGRFRDATGGSEQAEGFIAVIWLGAAVAAVLAILVVALFVVLGVGLRRGSRLARGVTFAVCALGIVGGFGSLAALGVQRSGEALEGSVGEALGNAYPNGWLGLNVAVAGAQVVAYLVVGALLLITPREFFGGERVDAQPGATPFGGFPPAGPPSGAGLQPTPVSGFPGYGPGSSAPGYGPVTPHPGYGPVTAAPPGYGPATAPPGYGPATAPSGYGPASAPPNYGPHPVQPGYGPPATAPGYGPAPGMPGYSAAPIPGAHPGPGAYPPPGYGAPAAWGPPAPYAPPGHSPYAPSPTPVALPVDSPAPSIDSDGITAGQPDPRSRADFTSEVALSTSEVPSPTTPEPVNLNESSVTTPISNPPQSAVTHPEQKPSEPDQTSSPASVDKPPPGAEDEFWSRPSHSEPRKDR